MKLDVKFDEQENKFHALVEGRSCVVNFRIIDAHTWEYFRTFVPEELRNRGIAGELVNYALHYAHSHNKKVMPSCSYIRSYIDEHPEWAIIVAR